MFVLKAAEAPPDSRAMEVALVKDLQQDASLEKKRYMELCRQGRVFNARNRIIGVRHRGGGVGGNAWKERLYRSTKFAWVDLKSLTLTNSGPAGASGSQHLLFCYSPV